MIGAGIAGAGAAYELSKAGQVLLLEAEDAPGYHATGRSAAHLTETYGNAVIRRLVKASRGFLEAPPENFAAHALVTSQGDLLVAGPGEEAALEADIAESAQLTQSIHRLTPREVLEMVPVLRPEGVIGGRYDSGGLSLDVHGLHQGYLRGLRERAGELITRAAVTQIVQIGPDWRCTTAAGEITAHVLVNAAGAWADQIAALAGVRQIGLVPKRRTAFTFDPPPDLGAETWPMLGDLAETWYIKPESGRLMGSPSDATPVAPQDVQPEELDIAIGVDRIQQATILEIPRLAHKWAGLRSFAADGSPVVGWGSAPGFFWLAGQGGYGVKTSPALSRLTAELICHDRYPKDLAELGLGSDDLSPDRLGVPAIQ